MKTVAADASLLPALLSLLLPAIREVQQDAGPVHEGEGRIDLNHPYKLARHHQIWPYASEVEGKVASNTLLHNLI